MTTDAWRPRHPAGRSAGAHDGDETALWHKGIRRPPAARWCARSVAGRRRGADGRRCSGRHEHEVAVLAADAEQQLASVRRRRRPRLPPVAGGTSARAGRRSAGRPTATRRRRAGRRAGRLRATVAVVGRGHLGELHLAPVVHPHGPAGRRVARRVGGAQAGERRVERVDAAQQEGAPGDLAPARVQQAAATRRRRPPRRPTDRRAARAGACR